MDADRLARYSFVPSAVPFTIVGAEGCELITDDGRRILDGAGGAIVGNIGHGRAEIVDAAVGALEGRGYVVPIWATDIRMDLMDRLVDRWLPPGLTRCLFVSGGSESVDTAMRVARQHHLCAGRDARWKVIGRTTSYHGATLATLAVANHDRRRAPFGPLLLDMPKADPLDIDQVAKLVEAEDPATIAAIIAEPVSGASGGALVPPPGYLAGLRAICDEHGILLIADEVMTGFGRTGRNFALDHWGVVPDILVGSKGLAGGYAAFGAVFATDAVVEPIAAAGDGVMFFTFSGTDLACAIADRVLQIMEDEDLVARAATQGERLQAALGDSLDGCPAVRDIRGLGLLRGVELAAAEVGAAEGELAAAVVREALARDCWIYPAGSALVPDALLLGPPFVVSDTEVTRIAEITRAAIDAATARADR